MRAHLFILVALSVVDAHADRAPASLDDADMRRYLSARKLVTLCGAPGADSVDLQPADYAPGARCFARGDFDGDGVDDVAVLIAERGGKKRAGVLVKAGGKLVQLGAGARTAWRMHDEKRGFIRGSTPADLAARASLRTYVWRGDKPPQVKGATLALSGGDATLAIFSDGRAWYAMPLGF